MQGQEGEAQRFSPEEGWESIHRTLDRTRSSMYVSGWQSIMLMWGAICAVGYISQYAVSTMASDFAGDYPWYPGALWGVMGLIGMVASSIIGSRASRRNAAGAVAKSAGIRVFAFWMTVVSAAFLIPAASGMWAGDWNTEANGMAQAGVAVGIIALGYILFGIMHHVAIALVGLGIAVAFYVPGYLAGDAAPVVSAVLVLAVVAVAWVWIRRDPAA